MTGTIQATFFYLMALAVLATAWYAVSSYKLLNAALSLALSFFAIGGLYFMLGNPFLGMLQILINAGAIPIVTVFIIMMTQSRYVRLKSPSSAIWAGLAMVLFANAVGVFVYRYANFLGGRASNTVTGISSGKLGEALLSSPDTNGLNGSLLAFEIVSVVLLVAMIGAIVLAKRDGETIKGSVGVLSEVEKPVLAGELVTPAMTIEQEAALERTKAGA